MNAYDPNDPLCPVGESFIDALRDGDPKRVARMLAADPLLMTARDGVDDQHPLELAMHAGHVECALAILPFCESDSISIFRAMVNAVRHQTYVDKLLRLERRVDKRSQAALVRSIESFLPLIEVHRKVQGAREQLILAAAAENYPAIIKLLKKGGDLSATDERGDTALHLAAGAGHLQCVHLLLPGSNPRATNHNGDTALHLAAKGDHVECARLILPGSDLLAENAEGRTALRVAAAKRSGRCGRLLIENSEPRAADSKGLTPLMMAALFGWSDLVEALLPLSDARAVAANGASALMAATEAGGPAADRCVELLAEFSNEDQTTHALAVLRSAGREKFYARVEAIAIGARLDARSDIPAAAVGEKPLATAPSDRAGRRSPRRM